MFESAQPSEDTNAAVHQAHRDLTTILRIGALLLGSGGSTNDVETTMLTLAQAAGLAAMQTTVISGLVSVSWDPGPPTEPITMIRVVRQRLTEYDRLADGASVVNRLIDRDLSFDEVDAQLNALERRVRNYSSRETLLATSASAAASTVLFGGGIAEAAAAASTGASCHCPHARGTRRKTGSRNAVAAT
jgi:uncharacterized membrane protein YjjP (DUF1212 family)